MWAQEDPQSGGNAEEGGVVLAMLILKSYIMGTSVMHKDWLPS